jgi:hypothetical protein
VLGSTARKIEMRYVVLLLIYLLMTAGGAFITVAILLHAELPLLFLLAGVVGMFWGPYLIWMDFFSRDRLSL